MKWLGNLSDGFWRNQKKVEEIQNAIGSTELAPELSNQFQSLLNQKTGAHLTGAQEEQNAFQERMANTVYQRGVVDMQQAGLNPALMFGSGSSGSPAPIGASASTGLGFGELVNLLMLPMQLKKMRSEIDNIGADTNNKVVQHDKILEEINDIKSQIDYRLSQKGLTDEQRHGLELSNAWIDRLNVAKEHEMQSSAALSDSQKNEIDKMLQGKLDIQIKTIQDFDRQWNLIDAEIRKFAAETNLLYEDIANYAINHMQNGFMGTGLSIVNLIRAALGINSSAHAGENAKLPDGVSGDGSFRLDSKGRPHFRVPGVRRGN